MNVKGWLNSNGGVLFLLLVLIGSLSTNVIQLYHYERAIHLTFPDAGIKLGTVLHSFSIVDKNGKKSQLNFSNSSPTVLYILAPTCPWCQRNQANITALALLKSRQYRLVGLSTTDYKLKEFWESTTLPFPVYSVTSSKALSDYHFSDETPQMAVVDSTGKVERVWHGAFVGENLSGVERYFGVKLPGLLDIPAQESSIVGGSAASVSQGH